MYRLEKDQGIARARAEIDDAADGDHHPEALDGFLQYAIDRARGISQHGAPTTISSPDGGAESIRPFNDDLPPKISAIS